MTWLWLFLFTWKEHLNHELIRLTKIGPCYNHALWWNADLIPYIQYHSKELQTYLCVRCYEQQGRKIVAVFIAYFCSGSPLATRAWYPPIIYATAMHYWSFCSKIVLSKTDIFTPLSDLLILETCNVFVWRVTFIFQAIFSFQMYLKLVFFLISNVFALKRFVHSARLTHLTFPDRVRVRVRVKVLYWWIHTH